MKRVNRAKYAVAGAVVMLFAGLVYAWTVLQAPIAASASEWNAGQLSLTFTIAMICWCLGGMATGALQKRIGVRQMLLTSAVMYLLGFVLTSASRSLPMLYMGFGVLGGLACGIVYNTVLSVASAWYRDRQGMVSGIMLMAFGFSSFVIGKTYTAVTPSDGGDAWRTSMLVLGLVVFAVIFAVAFVLKMPPDDWRPRSQSSVDHTARSYEEIGPDQMVRRSSFWILFAWATVLTISAMAIISQGAPIALEACPQLGMSSVATIVGLLSICNGIGRVCFGALFDRKGHLVTMLAGGSAFLVAFVLLSFALIVHSAALLVSSYVCLGLAYGSVSPTNSAFVNRFYGSEHYAENLPIVNLNILVSSFGSAIAGWTFDTAGSYLAVVVVAAVLVVFGTILSLLVRNTGSVIRSEVNVERGGGEAS